MPERQLTVVEINDLYRYALYHRLACTKAFLRVRVAVNDQP